MLEIVGNKGLLLVDHGKDSFEIPTKDKELELKITEDGKGLVLLFSYTKDSWKTELNQVDILHKVNWKASLEVAAKEVMVINVECPSHATLSWNYKWSN